MTLTNSSAPSSTRDPYAEALYKRSLQLNLDFFSPHSDHRRRRIWKAVGSRPGKKTVSRTYTLEEVWVNAPTEIIAKRIAKSHFAIYGIRLSGIYECSWEEYGRHLERAGFEISRANVKSPS